MQPEEENSPSSKEHGSKNKYNHVHSFSQETEKHQRKIHEKLDAKGNAQKMKHLLQQ